MIIEKEPFITNNDGDETCEQCGEDREHHYLRWCWIFRKKKNVGHVGIKICESTKEEYVFYFEIWNDETQYQRALEKMHDPKFSHYGVREFEDVQDLIDDNGKNDHEIAAQYTLLTDRRFLARLSKHKIEHIITLASEERKRRFKRQKDCKRGNINKGFTKEELDQFLKHVKNPKAHLAFTLQAYLGLRVGEVVSIKLQNIDLTQRQLYVQTEKAHTGDRLYLHDQAFAVLAPWIQKHREAIIAHEGYVLFGKEQYQHLSSAWLRGYFRKALKRAGLDQVYAKSTEPIEKTPRALHRFSTHSLRHYFGTSVYKQTKDPVITQRLLRHTEPGSTMTYIHTAQQDLDKAIRETFKQENEQSK